MTTLAEMLNRQTPLETKFGYRTTAAEVIADFDLNGKTAIVTGGYSGLGRETTLALLNKGVQVIVPARRPEVAVDVLDGFADARVEPMDLSDLESVAAFTKRMRDEQVSVDLVLNVAGVMSTPQQLTPQGWDWQFGTNHLGHFALVGGIADLLNPGARVVAYSSVAHFRCPVLFEDINFQNTPYDPVVAYGQSKTADALFAVALDSRGAERDIHAYSVHPGGIMTELQRHMAKEDLIARQWIDEDGVPNPLFKTPAEGASTGLWAATATELLNRGGVYCEDCSIKGVVPADFADVVAGGVKQWAIDPEAAERLWDISVDATGVNPLG